MLKVLFFASVREQLDCAALDIALPDQGLDLENLRAMLWSQREPKWRGVLEQENLICAVNQVVVRENCALADGDEVAFFPPVTGG
jgi:molybdopterin synthase sulfur carrier subunit